MNRARYTERLMIDFESGDPLINLASQVAGEGGSNVKYIYNETGAKISVRGRGSGYMEPRTGREDLEPLHVLVEHQNNYKKFQKACELVRDLIETVKDDLYKKERQSSRSQGQRTEEFKWQREREEEEENKTRYSMQLQDVSSRGSELKGNVQSYRDETPSFRNLHDNPREMENWERGREYDRPGNSWGFNRNEDRRNFCANVSSRERDVVNQYSGVNEGTRDERVREIWQSEGKWDRENRWGSEEEEGENLMGISRQENNRWNDSRPQDMNNWDAASHQEDRRWPSSGYQAEEQNVRNAKESYRGSEPWTQRDQRWAQKYKNNDQEDLGSRKKSRWDTSASGGKKTSDYDQSVLGVVLGQKQKIEEKLERNKSVKDRNMHQGMPAVDFMNPFCLNQNQLQDLNQMPLLEVCKEQQALLMQLASGLSKQPLSSGRLFPSKTANSHEKPSENLPSHSLSGYRSVATPTGVPFPFENLQHKQNTHYERSFDSAKERTSISKRDKFDVGGNSYSQESRKRVSDQAPWNEPSTSRTQISLRSWEKEREQPISKNKSYSLYSERDENSPPRGYAPPSSRYPLPDRYSPDPRHPPQKYEGSERYSPQLNDDQDRYSPQQENYLNKSCSELFSRRDNYDRTQMDQNLSPKATENKMLRFRVALINNKLNKLSSQDEEEIKHLVFKELNSLPSNNVHDIDFLGFASQDFIYILLPHTIEGMKWLVDMLYLQSMRRNYILFPYEDIYNRIKMRTTLFYELLDGYRPNPEEVILELGRLNKGLFTEMWKIVKFKEEKNGFFFMLSVDFLSFLQVRKLQWKLRYRVSFTRLEPLKSEKKIDQRFDSI